MEFNVDPLDRDRARAEARSRLFASPERVRLGRYELVCRLGAGSWGTVYQAFDPLASRMVALKVMHGRIEGQRDALARWRRESQLLAKLDHPHIIAVYDAGVDAGRAYLVTQLVRNGRTLTRWRATAPVHPCDALRRFIPLADALSAVHACGVLHRDIKPDNILVDADGNFCLADFGLASELQDVASAEPRHRFEGTPAFLPPDVRGGATPDERADLYSLCGSLWFALCGTPPMHGTPPRAMAGLLRRGLARDPKARFASALEFQRALEVAAHDNGPWLQLAASLLSGALVLLAALPPVARGSVARTSFSAAAQARPAELALDRIAKLHAAEDFEEAARLAREALGGTTATAGRAALELALGRARHAQGEHDNAAHVLEAAFFRSLASGQTDIASRAALLRFEGAIAKADLWGANVWEAETDVWLERRATTEPSLELRFATAHSKRLSLHGHPREALLALPTVPHPGASPRATLSFLFFRGALLSQAGDGVEGLRTFEAADAIAAQHFAVEHPRRRTARLNLAASQLSRGDFGAAAAGFEALLETCDDTSLARLPEVALLHQNLGSSYYELGDVPRALAHTQSALKASASAHGDAHPTTLDILGNLAATLHLAGQYEAARSNSWRALVAAETLYGSEDLRLATLLVNLAVMKATPEDGDEAESLLRRAEAIVQTHRGPRHREMALVQTNLAFVRSRRGDTAGALDSATEALWTYEATLGPDHPELAQVLLQLADLQLGAGQLEAARAHALRVRALPAVNMGHRSRAALLLAQVGALQRPRKSPQPWLTVAAQELEQSPHDLDSNFARVLGRWQVDWRAEASELRH